MSESKNEEEEDTASIYKLAEAYTQWKYHQARFGKRCLVSTPNPRGKGWAFTIYPRSKFFRVFRDCPRYHEAIFPDEPCKLFLDVEIEQEKVGPNDDVHEIGRNRLKGVMAAVDARLKELGCQFGASDDPLVFTGSRPGKFSVHVIYPTRWFKHPSQLLAFIEPLDEIVDRNPIKRALTGVSWLRLPFAARCAFVNEVHEMIPDSELKEIGGAKISVDLFFRACVSIGMCDPPEDESLFVGSGELPSASSTANRKSVSSLDPQTLARVEHAARGVLEMIGVERANLTLETSEDWKAYVNQPFFCANLYRTKRVFTHKRNNCIARMLRDADGKMRIRITCLDAECHGHSRLLEEDFTCFYTELLRSAGGSGQPR